MLVFILLIAVQGNQCIHFYICNGNGSDNKIIQDAINGMHYNHKVPEYVVELGPLAIMQAPFFDNS